MALSPQVFRFHLPLSLRLGYAYSNVFHELVKKFHIFAFMFHFMFWPSADLKECMAHLILKSTACVLRQLD